LGASARFTWVSDTCGVGAPTVESFAVPTAPRFRSESNGASTLLFVSHDRHFLSGLSNRVLELTPGGAHVYGGGYTEYVARTGHEAPGV
jgi:ABC-type polysaccharide/polyol phosphate transport system ATPase subunit